MKFFTIYPNPAKAGVTPELKEKVASAKEGVSNLSLSEDYEIQIWANYGLVKSFKTNGLKTQLYLCGLPEGLYSVHLIKDGLRSKSEILIVKRN